MKSYIQPFERRLAMEELQALAQCKTLRHNGSDCRYRVETTVSIDTLRRNLAYWESIETRDSAITTQSMREATTNVVRNGIPLRDIAAKVKDISMDLLPNRRCLRYGTHGIHEYRGKFFPQLVKALINIAEVPPKGIIADPMCGSGTTIVEGVLAGCHAIGMDFNPLSVELTRVKCDLVFHNPDELVNDYEHLRSALLARPAQRDKRKHAYLETLPKHDQVYLSSWFSKEVLRDLDDICVAIDSISNHRSHGLMRIVLSNILRSVSWQKDDDLRVRKEVREDVEIDAVREYLEELGRSVRLVLAFLYQQDRHLPAVFNVQGGDARQMTTIWRKNTGGIDCIITSPPYATSLPYIDTDRLSLCFFKLLSRPNHRKHDLEMIGNREITEGVRKALWEQYMVQRHALPDAANKLILRINNLNTNGEVGFRRRNLSALLAKYFLDMRVVLEGMSKMLKRNRPAYVVVGSNHTVAGGVRVDIDTASLLAEIAETISLKVRNRIPMEMLISRDIFRNNASNQETILELRRQ
jgi:site-specific DNA-methyltransferase (cytosine-N4-specific)